MPITSLNIPNEVVAILSQAIADREGVPVPPTNAEKEALLQQHLRRYLMGVIRSYKADQAQRTIQLDKTDPDTNWVP